MHLVKEAANAEWQWLEMVVFLKQAQVRGQPLMSYTA